LQTEFGRYHLLRHLATGGMGEVYLAEAKGAAGFAKRVVVKTLRQDLAADSELVSQFVAEGQLLEALDHPNIAQILDLGLQGDTYFLAMEFVEGFDLRALQRAVPTDEGLQRLHEPAVLFLLASVAHALDHAQTRRGPDGRPLRIVHHDVTPSNIMVRRDGHCKLVDFGVARSAVMSRLSPGSLRGKLPYLSPEHARHQRVDARADLFSLGLVAIELLSGQRALEATEPEALEDAYARLPDRVQALVQQHLCGPGTQALIGALVATEAAQRPATAGEVADRAESLLVALGEASPARRLATDLGPAFGVLEARAGSFDQTLSQMLGVSEAWHGDEKTGTLSLPGLDVVQVAAASARDEQAIRQVQARLREKSKPPRGRKRLATAAVILLAGAVGVGFWLGNRRPVQRVRGMIPPMVRVVPLPDVDAGALLDGAQVDVAQAVTPTPLPRPVPVHRALPLPVAVTVAAPEAGTRTDDTQEPSHGGRGQPHKTKDPQEKWGTLKFKVLPADCKVTVDGEPRRATVKGSNVYEIRVPPGDHRVRIQDPDTGQSKEIEVRGLGEGEEKKVPGTSLDEGLP
jgi:hypothetical protein